MNKASVKGSCIICGCAAKIEHVCVTCEELHAASPSYMGCLKHEHELLEVMKRHALTQHPGEPVPVLTFDDRDEGVSPI